MSMHARRPHSRDLDPSSSPRCRRLVAHNLLRARRSFESGPVFLAHGAVSQGVGCHRCYPGGVEGQR